LHIKKINIRKKAVDLLILTEKEGSFSDLILNNLIKTTDIESKDRRLLTEIFYGTLRNKIRLDSIIYSSTDREKKIDVLVLNVLRVSVYQLLYLDRVPDFAVIDEAVKIVKRSKKKFLAGFVNALLRKIANMKADYQNEKEPESLNDISKRYSFPYWLVEYLEKMWGRNEAVKFMKHTLSPGALVVMCTKNSDAKNLEKSFDEEGVSYERLALIKDAYRIESTLPINELESFRRGDFIVQSVASAIVVTLLSAKEGDCVLDLCSAPGTKTVGLASLVSDSGMVYAADLYHHRLLRVKENVRRYKLNNVLTLSLDARRPLPFKDGVLFDKVLVDAPCSGLGIVKKTPEIKYKVTYDDVKELSALELNILTNASRYVKPGGKLVYSTCSITYEENESVVKKFLEINSDFVIEKITDANLKENGMVDEHGFFKTLPHIHHTDGFFAAVLINKNS
jgi:16S rRNA (cytosine967-C5)-methyltransferase